MKKTLFLSAILGAALCSTAFADVNTETVTKATVTVGSTTIPAEAGTVTLVTTSSTNREQVDLPANISLLA